MSVDQVQQSEQGIPDEHDDGVSQLLQDKMYVLYLPESKIFTLVLDCLCSQQLLDAADAFESVIESDMYCTFLFDLDMNICTNFQYFHAFNDLLCHKIF